MKLRWYPAVEPVKCLPFPSKINSLDWCSHKYVAAGVGEVFGAARPYNGAKALPYAQGIVPCEDPAVFRNGETFDAERPPQEYNADRFPLCCLNIAVGAGGIEWGGAAVIVEPPTIVGGPDCAGAVLIEANTWYAFDEAAYPFETWFLLNLPLFGPGTYHFEFESDAPASFDHVFHLMTVFEIGPGGCPSGAQVFGFAGALPLTVDAVIGTIWGDAYCLRSALGSAVTPGRISFRINKL